MCAIDIAGRVYTLIFVSVFAVPVKVNVLFLTLRKAERIKLTYPLIRRLVDDNIGQTMFLPW